MRSTPAGSAGIRLLKGLALAALDLEPRERAGTSPRFQT
jgi:hypothetical protein